MGVLVGVKVGVKVGVALGVLVAVGDGVEVGPTINKDKFATVPNTSFGLGQPVPETRGYLVTLLSLAGSQAVVVGSSVGVKSQARVALLVAESARKLTVAKIWGVSAAGAGVGVTPGLKGVPQETQSKPSS